MSRFIVLSCIKMHPVYMDKGIWADFFFKFWWDVADYFSYYQFNLSQSLKWARICKCAKSLNGFLTSKTFWATSKSWKKPKVCFYLTKKL